MTSTNKFHVYKGNFSYVVKRLLKERENWEQIKDKSRGIRKAQFIWKPTKLPRIDFNIVHDRIYFKDEKCVTNHLRGNRVICTKTGIMRSMQNYYKQNEMLYLNNLTFNDVLPTCFLITSGVEDNEYYRFSKRYEEIGKKDFKRERMPEKHCQDNWWLIKPANLNQGRGIKISNEKSEILYFIKQQIPHSLWVIQKYLEKPLLYNGRKFDIRLWALVTYEMTIYIYKKSYVRTSSAEFTLNSTDDKVTHLTNNCFQVKCDTYGKHEEGNIVAMSDLEQYIKENKYQDYTLNEHFFPYAKNHVLDVVLSGSKSLQKVDNCFELYGFDLMIDEDLRVWLIECNTNPHLGMPNKMMKTQVPTMINEMLNIVIDPIYPPSKEPEYEKGNFWKIYEDKGLKKKIRDYEILQNGLYPVKEIVPKSYLSRTIGNIKDGRFQNRSYQRLSKIRKMRGKKRERGNLSISQDDLKNLTEDEDDRSSRSSYLNKSVNSINFGKIKKKSKKKKKNYQKQNIENVKSLIYKSLQGRYLDEEYLNKLLQRCFSCIGNFVLYSDDQLEIALKAIEKVQNTQFDYMIANEKNIQVLILTLKDEQLKEEFFQKLIKILERICENYKLRWNCEKDLDNLIKILGEYLLPYILEESDNQSQREEEILISIGKILGYLAGNYDRKFYVPGETVINDKIRILFVLRGGLLILAALLMKLKNKKIYKFPKSIMDKYLKSDDWILLKEMIKELKENDNKPFDQVLFIDSVASKFSKKLQIALSKASSTVEKFEVEISDKMKADILMHEEGIKEVDEEDEEDSDDQTYSGLIYNIYVEKIGMETYEEFMKSKITNIKQSRIRYKKDEKKRKLKQIEKKNELKVKKEREMEARREQIERHMRLVNQKMRKYKREKTKKSEITEKKISQLKEERKKKIIEKLKQREQENQKKRKERLEKEKIRRQNIKNMLKNKRDDQLRSGLSSQSNSIRLAKTNSKFERKTRTKQLNSLAATTKYNYQKNSKKLILPYRNNHSTPSSASNKPQKTFKVKSGKKGSKKKLHFSSKIERKPSTKYKSFNSSLYSRVNTQNSRGKNIVRLKVTEMKQGEGSELEFEDSEFDPDSKNKNYKMRKDDVILEAVRLKNPGSRHGARNRNYHNQRALSGQEKSYTGNRVQIEKEDKRFFKNFQEDVVRLNTGYAEERSRNKEYVN